MPSAIGHDVTEQRGAEQHQVADGVEDLVAHEFVLETQLVVEDRVVANDDGVVHGAAQGQAVLP